DQRRSVLFDRGYGVGHAVGADIARSVVKNAQAGADAGRDVKGLRAKVALADLLEDRLQVRDDAGDYGLADVGLAETFVAGETEHKDAELVGQFLNVGGEAPGGAESFAVEDADGDVSIT